MTGLIYTLKYHEKKNPISINQLQVDRVWITVNRCYGDSLMANGESQGNLDASGILGTVFVCYKRKVAYIGGVCIAYFCIRVFGSLTALPTEVWGH